MNLKTFLHTIKIIVLALVIAIGVNAVSAEYLPVPPGGPTSGQPPAPINVGSTPQGRIGALGIGKALSSTFPTSGVMLDVFGALNTTSLLTFGNANVYGNLTTNNLAISNLTSSTPATLCANSSGEVVFCGPGGTPITPINPVVPKYFLNSIKYDTPGAHTWIAPSDITGFTVEAYGGGGGGALVRLGNGGTGGNSFVTGPGISSGVITYGGGGGHSADDTPLAYKSFPGMPGGTNTSLSWPDVWSTGSVGYPGSMGMQEHSFGGSPTYKYYYGKGGSGGAGFLYRNGTPQMTGGYYGNPIGGSSGNPPPGVSLGYAWSYTDCPSFNTVISIPGGNANNSGDGGAGEGYLFCTNNNTLPTYQLGGGGGGGSGGYIKKYITIPATGGRTYSITVGAGGSAGTNAGSGAPGAVIITYPKLDPGSTSVPTGGGQ